MSTPLRVLVVEDSEDDALLVLRELRRSGYDPTSERVDTPAAMSAALDKRTWDIVTADYTMPHFSAPAALRLLQKRGLDLPFIIVSGSIGEETAVEAMKAGAHDYLMKDRLARLGSAVERELRDAEVRRARQRAEKETALTLKVLQHLNESGGQREMFRDILKYIKEFAGCEAVGIRLQEGEDFPYYETKGFTVEFVQAESSLCVRDLNGQLARDDIGNAVLECMCGNIICGRFDPQKSFFTQGGSFWTNSTSELLASTSEEDRQARTRNRCNGEDYESVALIPLRFEGGNIGLLQLNDRRRNRFTPALVEYFEEIGESIGVILGRKRAEERLRESEARFRTSMENMLDCFGIYSTVRDQSGRITDFRIEYVNEAACANNRMTKEEQIGKRLCELLPAHRETGLFNEYCQVVETNKPLIKESLTYEDVYGGQRLTKTFDIRVVRLRDGFAAAWRDVTERKRAEAELVESFERLRKAMEGTVQTLVRTYEMRDPYTAGHERRVCKLVCAIAREMGLSEKDIEGIRIAASIHDFGKIYVPAEILNKPGQLSEIEFAIVKTHAQAGYDILKPIEFPWPVAQIIAQHHERMDGSGYPSALSGEDICLEARILGVADVVEAMASHRPYRPALGLDKALQEISQDRGVLYDAGVVDICVRVFTEKGFTFD